MAGKGEVRYKLVIDGEAAEAAIDGFSEKVVGLGTAFLSIETAAKVVDKIAESLQALGEKQDVVNRLSMSIGGSGAAAESAKTSLLEYADALEQTSTASSKTIIGIEAYFSQLGATEAQVKSLTQATLDFAARTGMDASEASMQFGKAIESGSARGLAKYGIEVDKSENATQRLDSVVKQIEERMGGSALAATTTYTGAKKQLAAAEEAANEQLGFFFATVAGGEKPYSTAIEFTKALRESIAGLTLMFYDAKTKVMELEGAVAHYAAGAAKAAAAIPGLGKAIGAKEIAGSLEDRSFDLSTTAAARGGKARDEVIKKLATGDVSTVKAGGGPGGSGLHGSDESGKAAEKEAEFWKQDAEAAKIYQEELGKLGVAQAAALGPLEKEIAEHQKARDEVYHHIEAIRAKEKEDFASGAISKEQLATAMQTDDAAERAADSTQKQADANSRMKDAVDRGNKSWREYITNLNEGAKAAEENEILRQQQIAKGIDDTIGGLGTIGSLVGGKVGGEMQSFSTGLKSTLGSYRDFQQAFFTGDVVGMVTAGLSTVKNLVGTIGGLFGGKTEAERIGEDLGEGVTDGLVKKINDTETKDKVGRAMAEALNSGEIFKETGKTDKIFDLLNAWKLGAVDAKEAAAAAATAFKDLQEAAAGGNVKAEGAMIAMIKRAKELGEEIPEIDAAVKGLMTDAAKQLQIMYDSQMPGAGGARQAAANNDLFDAVADSKIATEGLVAADEELHDDLQALAKANGGKLTGDAAEMQVIDKLLQDPAFKGSAKGSAAAAAYNKDILDSGEMSQKTLDALQTTAGTYYDQALDAASKQLDTADAQKAALEASLPFLGQLQHDQELGLKLSPDMQKMLADANAEGLLPVKTLAEQSFEVDKQSRDYLAMIAGVSTSDPSKTTPPAAGGPPAAGTPFTRPGSSQPFYYPGSAAGVPFRAAATGYSGTVTRPHLFLAGENGPEDVNIQPIGGGSGRMPMGGGAPTIHNSPTIHINGSGLNEDELLRVVNAAIDRNTNSMMTKISRRLSGKF